MKTADWAIGLAERLGLEKPKSSVIYESISPDARPPLVASHFGKSFEKALIITGTFERALHWQAKLILCGINPDGIHMLPCGTSSLFEDAVPEHIALSDRLGALRALAEDIPCFVITTPSAALERTIPKPLLLDSYFEVATGETLDESAFIKRLVRLGYEHQEPVRIPGSFSRRGGIIDVFAVGRTTPVRIELFGDQVESMRSFDPNTQRSVGTVSSLQLSPSRETLFPDDPKATIQWIRESLEQELAQLSEPGSETLRNLVEDDIASLEAASYFDRLDLYRPLIHSDSNCAVELLEAKDWLILDEPLELDAVAERAGQDLEEALKGRQGRGEMLKALHTDFLSSAGVFADRKNVLSLTAMNDVPDWANHWPRQDVNASSLDMYRGQPEALSRTIKNYLDQGVELVAATDQPSRVAALFSQIEIALAEEPTKGRICLSHGNLAGGFICPNAQFGVLTDAELFGVARLKLPQRRFMEGAPISTVLDLKEGDYVVHVQYGIGVFRGLVKRQIQGIEKEFLYIEYAAPDRLFVPADQLDRVQKYLNPTDDHPKLNRLTGGEWQKTLGKARDEARDFARDLVKLYATRKSVTRRPLPPDTPWQEEMESTFPYVETQAQMSAIQDVKKDLEVGFPMDRLVCGDVGFGKTEVAIRAAFKVALDNRQVAILCPTTILSEQHYRNFSERMSPFGTRIELLNRFRKASDKAEVIRRVESGHVDVLIGTHSLLGKGLKFKDLGLVVVDEEQKFGVKQKEMLKRLRAEVDVLTLSATPIPRTLSMALMDIRQMSLINDPPPGRLPVRSYLRAYADEVVREAILRELARGGQVFYVYNRVDSIGHVAQRLRNLIPHAKIGVGHGQMTEAELEPIMIGFIKGEIDILLSTTIIENGIDISNANTLIVENADRLGLSQLYQLRGRVGRSDRQAYAYFLYGKKEALTENALARLQALKEFSTLGSGYSLAFRDLQIRGAGELLGAKQHGVMATVGFELYSQLINEAVAILKNSVDGNGDSTVDGSEPSVGSLEPLPVFDMEVPALIPEPYIRDQAQRLYYYQRMMSCRTEEELAQVQAEIVDRYGRAPVEVKNAFQIMNLRVKGRTLGLEKLLADGGRIECEFRDWAETSMRFFSILAQTNKNSYYARGKFTWTYSGSTLNAVNELIHAMENAIEKLASDRAALGV